MDKHCCNVMDYYANNKNILVDYDFEKRLYSFILHDDPDATRQEIYYCPWCGNKMPDDLADKWIEILETEYSIEEPQWNRDKVPQEFLTDEWWKKRNL